MKKEIYAITQPAVNQASFSKDAFEKILIFYPDNIPEQNEIIEKLKNPQNQLSTLNLHLKKLYDLRKYVIIALFSQKIKLKEDSQIV
jgi:hypothetical protein